jgi:signal transduction histidine kinase
LSRNAQLGQMNREIGPWIGTFVSFVVALLAAVTLLQLLMAPPITEIAKVAGYLAVTGIMTMGLGWIVIVWLTRHKNLSLQGASFLSAAVGGGAALANLLIVARLMFVSTSHDLPLLAATIAFSVVLTLFFSYRVAGLAVQRIRSITVQIERLADGNFVAPLDGRGGDEVARLAAHVNTLARRLRAAEQERIALDAERRELTTAISHDLRTPLASIRAMVEALDDHVVQEPAEIARYLGMVRREIDRLNRMIDDLMELARLDAGAPGLVRQPVLLSEIAAEVVDALQAPAKKQDVALRLTVAHDPPPLPLDGSRIERALSNLVRNALEHTPPGGHINVAVGADSSRAWFRVHDTGGGIAPADFSKIWDRFYRGDKARARSLGDGDGAGLGLAIVRSIIEAHDGTVSVRSPEGLGAEFEVILPLCHEGQH